jgi:hypothetical protein
MRLPMMASAGRDQLFRNEILLKSERSFHALFREVLADFHITHTLSCLLVTELRQFLSLVIVRRIPTGENENVAIV